MHFFEVAMRLKYLSSLGLRCFAVLVAGAGVSGMTPAFANGGAVKTISISMQPQAPINALMYGANYQWDSTAGSQFPAWINSLTSYAAQPSAPVTFFRYPGGWDGEWYDWGANQMYPGGPASTAPGEPPGPFLKSVQPMSVGMATRAASFVLSTRNVIHASPPSTLPAAITQQTDDYVSLISLYQNNVSYWEIGNEWWLQNGAGSNTAPLSANNGLTINLTRYAALVAAAAPVLKADFPNIKLYVTADWTTAGGEPANDQFVQLRNLVGPAAWADIDGISIHTYCGLTVAASLCSALPAQVAAIKQDTGKTDIYASEWSLGPAQVPNDYGIQNANATVSAFRDMAEAGITKATYWPSMGQDPSIALTTGTSLTVTGMLFRAMSRLYEGEAIPAKITTNSGPAGQTVAIAAANTLSGKKGIVVIVATNGDPTETINLSMAGTGMTQVANSSVIYSLDDSSGATATTSSMVNLNTTMVPGPNGSSAASFVLNPGGWRRGSNWEIAIVQLQ
jgi:hypothetical protein